MIPSNQFWEIRDQQFYQKWSNERSSQNSTIKNDAFSPSQFINNDLNYMCLGNDDDFSHTGSIDPSNDDHKFMGSMDDFSSSYETTNSLSNMNISSKRQQENFSPFQELLIDRRMSAESFFTKTNNMPSKNILSPTSLVGQSSSNHSSNSHNVNSFSISQSLMGNNMPNSPSSPPSPTSIPTDCFEIYNQIPNGSFKVSWIPPPVSAYQRWTRPLPVVKYQISPHQICCIEVRENNFPFFLYSILIFFILFFNSIFAKKNIFFF